MKKKKLYIKNEKGRYEEYKPERKTDDSELFFRKIKGKFIYAFLPHPLEY